MDDATLDPASGFADYDGADEIQQMRDEFFAKWGTNIRGACEEGERFGRALGMHFIESEDDPMHPRNVNRRYAETGRLYPDPITGR